MRRSAIEITCLALLSAICVYAAASYDRLPATIPTHFGIAGAPDAYGGRGTIWFLPAIAVLMYAGLSAVQFIPARFYNLPVDRAALSRPAVAAIARELIAVIKILPLLTFLAIEWITVESAMTSRLMPYATMLILIPTFGLALVVIWYTGRLRRAANS